VTDPNNSKSANSKSVRSESASSKLDYSKPAYSSAAERNSQPIFEQLSQLFPAEGKILEIGSGTGQHAVYFCHRLPALDVLQDDWPTGPFDAAYSANTSHIMSWEAVQATFVGVAKLLKPGARFCLYGPFNVDGEFTAPSNAEFDKALRAGESEMGLRDVADIEKLGFSHQLLLECKIAMPANNFILVFKRTGIKK